MKPVSLLLQHVYADADIRTDSHTNTHVDPQTHAKAARHAHARTRAGGRDLHAHGALRGLSDYTHTIRATYKYYI